MPVENVVGIAATGSEGSPWALSQYDSLGIESVHYLSARYVGVSEFPKCFWEVQYPLLNLLETYCVGADSEGASIPWICLELKRAELMAEGGNRYKWRAYKYKPHEEIYTQAFGGSCR